MRTVIFFEQQMTPSPTLIAEDTVDSEIFARILFSRKALKDIFVTLKIRNYSMIYIYQ